MPLEKSWAVKDGVINNVKIVKLEKHDDHRGFLVEMWRSSRMPYDNHNHPLQGYYSVTSPGILRGPHEHKYQFDNFIFMGTVELYLWERIEHEDVIVREKKMLIGCYPELLITIPPGVVHAYKNVGDSPCISMNFPNQYYGGRQGKDKPDEIRHESIPGSPYQIW